MPGVSEVTLRGIARFALVALDTKDPAGFAHFDTAVTGWVGGAGADGFHREFDGTGAAPHQVRRAAIAAL